MPIEITGRHPPEHRLEVGDVILVSRELRDKETKKPFQWKYFAMVTKVGRGHQRLEHIILDEKEREPKPLFWSDHAGTEFHVWYLPEAEWPDGVYAFRTKLILEGRIDLDL